MLAPALMVQGTASSVGKSLLVTALCRLFRRDGVDVVPFKSQNMALNSAVTPDGFEIGRAQAVQAEAAGVAPCVEMNPILLKPEGHQSAQVVIRGRPAFRMSAREYHDYKPQLAAVVADCLGELRRRHQLVIIEGAGSPAEVNLRDRDIVNMHVARLADAPVILVGDIDRGGVFAALLGTLDLLEPEDRQRVAALLVNNFRGDLSLFEPGVEFLRQKSGKPVLGVVPHVSSLRIADEDSLALERRAGRPRASAGQLDIAVVKLPRISNYDDVLALEHAAGVSVRFVQTPEELRGADLVILPGTKSTVADLGWLRATGLAAELGRRGAGGGFILGICGGCQMLGEWILDPDGVESSQQSVPGIGLLGLCTRFEPGKLTAQVETRVHTPGFFGADHAGPIHAYEIHMGQLSLRSTARGAFRLSSRNGQRVDVIDGAISATGNVVGTLLHGLLENEGLRASLLAALRRERGGEATPSPAVPTREAEYDRLEAAVRQSLDLQLLRRLAQQPDPG